MNINSLSDVNLVYQNSQKCRINYYTVEHEQFQDFCFGLSQLDRYIKRENLDDDECWKDFLLTLKRYRYQLCSTPIPFNSPEIVEKINLHRLKQELRKFQLIYPEISHLAKQVFNQFYTLIQLSDNPLLDYVEHHLYNSDYQSRATPVLLQRSRQIPLVNNYQLSNLELLIPSKLRDCEGYEKLTVIGCSRWFPEHIFSAPRAKEINVVHYDWFKDKWKAKPVFVASQNFEQENKKDENTSVIKNTRAAKLDPEEILLPTIDINEIAKQYSHSSSNNVDKIEANLFSLEGDTGVFLDKETKTFIIDITEEYDSIVARKSVAKIERDMFILLRTQGGGDYIKETADKILHQSGENTTKLRKLQKEWKLYLKNMINRTNLYSVCVRLGREGCKLANSEISIRNCISENYIKPRNKNDFRIILELIGLGHRFDEFYNAACLISKAHQKAGHYLGKLLRQNIENYDLNELEQKGTMEFRLDEEDSGSLTAFRVLDISTKTFSVPFSQHGKPFEI